MYNKTGISIVIPVLNEKKNLTRLIPDIYKIVNIIKFEIIIVDDSSNDGTSKLIKNYKNKKKTNNLKCIQRKNEKRDLSKSCILGFEKSIYNYILVMDGDYQHNPIYINKMYNCIISKNLDVVVGCRPLFSKKIKGLSFLRINMSRFITLLINFIFGYKTSDPMSGFFIFKKRLYLNNKKKLFKRGYKILFDLITTKNKIKAQDININFLYRKKGKSKMNLKILFILINHIIFKIFMKLKNSI